MKAALALFLLTACGSIRSYPIKSGVNEAVYYRARYVEKCVTNRDPSIPCKAWHDRQERVDSAAGEAVDALKVGGSAHLQVAALRRELAALRKEFAAWVE